MDELCGKYCRVHFRLKCQLKLGQTVGVGGSCYSLGCSDNAIHVPLVTDPDSYPLWYTQSPVLVKAGEDVTYKYCILEGGKIKHWELHARKFTPGIEDDIILEDKVGTFDLHENLNSETDLTNQMLDLYMNDKQDDGTTSVLTNGSRVIIVCYHLPVKISRSKKGDGTFSVEWSESLIAKSTTNSISSKLSTYWFGTIDVKGDPLTSNEKETLEKILHGMNCYPVFIDRDTANKAYLGFCKQTLWPIFHNIDQLDQIHAAWNIQVEETVGKPLDWNEDSTTNFNAYQTVNMAFFNALATMVTSADIVWVHDYHLMLLPKLVRDMKLALSIVFFLHIPFPTSQIFRTIPAGTDFLYSMTCADVVGFHSFDHARHFLNATKRTLGLRSYIRQGGMLSIKVGNREVIVTMSHVSIEPDKVSEAVSNEFTESVCADTKKKYPGKKIIVGVDVCQRLSGLSLKLAAYEKLLTDYPSLQGKVVLIQKCLRPNNRVADEMTTSADLKQMVNSLHEKFSTPESGVVIDYEELPSISLNERTGLFLAADVFLLTALREGLNLMPLEYVYARKDLPFAGVVVASEYTACSSLLSGSLKVNPYYTLSVSDTLHRALEMSPKECSQRMRRDLPFVANHPSSKWTSEILYDLECLRRSSEKNKLTNSAALPKYVDTAKVLETYKTVGDLGIADVGKRVFVFDYGGTIIQKEKFDVYLKHTLSAISGRRPSETILSAIRSLSEDPRNAVMILTGLTKAKLGDVFQGMPNVTIATSSGLLYSWGESIQSVEDSDLADDKTNEGGGGGGGGGGGEKVISNNDRKWGSYDFNIDWESVRNIAVPIMTKFTFRTNGTCLSPRVPGIGWSYFGADPEWGETQSIQLKIELEAALANHDVKITSQIQGSIEIVPRVLHKGLIVRSFLDKVLRKRAGDIPKFVMVVGDEPSDDKMFDVLYELAAEVPASSGIKSANLFTVTVGRKESSANLYFNEVKDVEDMLVLLSKVN